MKRSRPGSPAVRKTREVGPDYAEGRYRNPVGADLDHEHGAGENSKTIDSPNGTTFGGAVPGPHKGYDSLWEGK